MDWAVVMEGCGIECGGGVIRLSGHEQLTFSRVGSGRLASAADGMSYTICNSGNSVRIS